VLQEPLMFFFARQPHLFELSDVNLMDKAVRYMSRNLEESDFKKTHFKAAGISKEVTAIIKDVEARSRKKHFSFPKDNSSPARQSPSIEEQLKLESTRNACNKHVDAFHVYKRR
jgi:hypothetical protein